MHTVASSAPMSVRLDSCPSCASSDWAVIGQPGSSFVTVLNAREYVQPDYEARHCRRCGLLFKSAIASPQVLADYYSQVDYRKWEIPGLFPTEEAVIRVLADLPVGSKVLDFGCSTGRLLSRLVGALQCHGFEINPEAAAEASRKGLRMLAADALFGEGSGLYFDAITVVDVVEHLTEPTKLLYNLTTRLVPGGLLVLSTGNADSSAARDDPATFWYFRNVEHVCMITRGYADFLAARLDLELLRWEAMSHYRQSLRVRAKELARATAYDSFHRGRRPWLRPLLRILPYFRRAHGWTERPTRTGTSDHVVAVFRKSPTR